MSEKPTTKPGRRFARWGKAFIGFCGVFILMLMTGYLGAYLSLRHSQVFTFCYPKPFLDRYLEVESPNPIITRNNAFSYDPIAEVRGLTVTPLSHNANRESSMRPLLAWFGPALALESRFRPNETWEVRGKIPREVAVASLKAKLMTDAGVELSDRPHASGIYAYHDADGKMIELFSTYHQTVGLTQTADRIAIIKGLEANPEFVGGPMKSSVMIRGRLTPPRPGYFYFQKGEGEHIEHWLIAESRTGHLIHYHKSYTDY